MRLSTRRLMIWISGAVVALTIGAASYAMLGRTLGPVHGTADGEVDASDTSIVPVTVVRPKQDPNFQLAVSTFASVEAYFQAGLRARVSGIVKRVAKDIGEPVRRGELLIEIEVPDLEQEVLQKESVIEQRTREWKLALAQVKNARALLDVAKATIAQRQAELTQARATSDYRRKRLARLIQLAKRDAVTPDIVEEGERDAAAAMAAVEGASAAVQKANADFAEKQAALETAEAEVDLRQTMIEVARKDRDRSQAQADYAHIVAPFDGVVTRRFTDPGMFVQSGATSRSEPLINISRVDVVTVVMKLPDSASPYVSRNTPVELRLDDLPGVLIRGTVVRFSPSIETSDRTVRVEVDLFNGSSKDFVRLRNRALGALMAPFAQANPSELTSLVIAGQTDLHTGHKSYADGLPTFALVSENLRGRRLLPGMIGTARVLLDQLKDAYLLPSSAVFSRGGKSYVSLVQDGVTQFAPVKVQVNDGRLVKAVIAKRSAGNREILREFDGTEMVVSSRQQEVGDGQTVRPTLVQW